MKNYLLGILMFLFPIVAFSQVGIGTITPNSSSMLDIAATNKGVLIPRVAIANLNTAAPVTSPAISLLVYNTTVATGLGFHYWDGTKWKLISGSADTDWTVVGNNMYNANTGFVGIGTTLPTKLVHIEDSSAPAIRLVSGNEGVGKMLTTDASGNARWEAATIQDLDWTITGNDMYSGNTGNVGIGTTAPVKRLHVKGGRILLENSSNTVLRTKKADWDANKKYDLIGTYTDAGFDPNAIYIGGYNVNNTNVDNFDNGNKVMLGWEGATRLQITATAFNVSSSRRSKSNISGLKYGLKDILKIKPVKYQYKADKSGLYTIGFIAEQVSEVIPEVVSHEDENGNVVSRELGRPVSMDYSKMNAVLVNAVKEQQAEIDILENENSELEKQITKFEKLLL